MPRPLSFNLDRVITSKTPREPAFAVEIYDLRSSGDTVGAIVRDLGLAQLTGPRDFTDEVLTATLTERAGDFVNTGVQAASLQLVFSDPNNLFHPLNLLLDPTGDGRWLRSGNAVRLIVGDNRVPRQDWATIFTGVLQGSPNVVVTRDGNRSQRRITVTAIDRSGTYLDKISTSDEFALGTTYISMATDIAQNDMNLDSDEISFAGFGTRTTGHTSTQFVEESPLSSLAKIMMVDGFMPIFDGEGRLTQTQANITGFPDRVYDDLDHVFSILLPGFSGKVFDSVKVLGLDATLSEVRQPFQDLAEVQITTGYFAQNETFDVYWSEDRTQIADNIDEKVLRAVNGALNFGGTQSFSDILAPGSLGGTIGVKVTVSTGFAPYLLILITASYFAASFIGDKVVSLGAGFTFPIGRPIQAGIMITILLIMTQIARLHVLFRGEPLEFVFAEIRARAKLTAPFGEDFNEVVVENHLVQDQATGDAVALEILFRQVARAQPRSIRMLADPRLIPNDVLQVTDPVYGQRRFLFETITTAYQRGRAPVSDIGGFEITAGLSP